MTSRPTTLALLLGLLTALACNSTSSSSSSASAVRGPDTVPPQVQAPEPASAPTIALPEVPAPDPREGIIAAGVRQMLQSEHVSARPIDDEVSSKACELFIEALDPGKLFLLQPQVDELRRHAMELDDQLAEGDLKLARLGNALRSQQRAKVASITAKLLSKPFEFETVEELETDAEKRTHAEDDAALEDLWRRHLKLQVLQRIARMQDLAKKKAEAEEKAANDKKSGKKPGKKPGKQARKKPGDISPHDGPADDADDEDGTSIAKSKEPVPTNDVEREAKARKDLATHYEGRFKRLATARPLEAVETFVNAITGVFDPHTLYMAPDEQANFDIQISGSLEGIGAVLTEDDHYIEIREVVAGGAAWRQGDLEAGDLILAVQQGEGEAVDVADMRLSEVVKLIRGPKGTLVTLTVRKPDDRVIPIEITRDVVVVEATYARGALLDLGKDHAKVGYIYLPGFYGNTRSSKGRTPERNAVDDVRALLEHFTREKVGSVLLDLRGNGGGLLSQAKDITGLFIERGPVVLVQGSGAQKKVLRDDDDSIFFSGPVVTLVDRFSASGAEIVAGALQDYRRAVIVGTGPTHGKGTVQMMVDLDRAIGNRGKPLGVLKLTIQQYFLVDGESTQQRGVLPDIVLPDPLSYLESGERFLDNAIPWSSVKPLPHSPWPGATWDMQALQTASKTRQAAREVFATITARGEHLAKRREETVVPLSLAAFQARSDADEKALEALDPKLDELPEQIAVKAVEYRPEKPRPGADARKDTGKRIVQWQKTLARDPWVSEALEVLDGMGAAR